MALSNIQIYDEECFPNIWTNMIHDLDSDLWYFFEVSDRINQIEEYRSAMRHWNFTKARQVGFNNVGYDYPVSHAIMTDPTIMNAADIFVVSKRIIDTPWENRWDNRIWESQHIVEQIDLFLIHHFDNGSKSTNLKFLEFVMRLYSIQDLPFKPETFLTHEQMDILIAYQKHDIFATEKFFYESLTAIEFRDELSRQHGKSYMNHNDGKIGESYFVRGLEAKGVAVPTGKNKIQTFREYIDIDEIIIPYITFDHPEFNKLLDQMRTERIFETKGANSWTATIDGFDYKIGLGGIHASVSGQIILADDEYEILDLDFASWYPHLSFNNNLYPQHMTAVFCEVYKDLYKERKTHKKGTTLNGALKLALNVAYGDSNSPYSIFYDPKFTMSITINGQLILCMLADQLIKIPNLQMIQCNTDGLTIKYPRKYKAQVKLIWKWIEEVTGIELEGAEYSKMIIRDVNNYIAVYTDGKTKNIGAYCYDQTNRVSGLSWNQDHGGLVIQKAACAALIHGTNVREFIMNHDDVFDFFLCTKVAKADKLTLHSPITWGGDVVLEGIATETLQNICRYYVSNTGGTLMKEMKRLKRRGTKVKMIYINWHSKKISGVNKLLEVNTKHEYNNAIRLGYRVRDGGTYTYTNTRKIGIDKDWLVTEINNITEGMEYDFNYEYYITEAEKLVNKVL